jgi:hypothetical protein
MKQTLIFSVIICLMIIFGACSDDSNPVTSTGPRVFDPFALWDTASNVSLGNRVQCMAVKDTFLFAGTSNAGIYRSTNNGENWVTVNIGLSSVNIQALLVKDTIIYAGTAVALYRSTDNGLNWGAYSSGMTNTNIRALAAKDSFIFAGTNGGGLYRSTNNGVIWTSAGLSGEMVITFAVKGSRLFAGTAASGIYRSTNNGTDWTQINTGMPGLTINALAAQDTNLYSATTWGIYRSSNDSSWSEVNEGLYSVLMGSADFTSLFVYGPSVLVGVSSYRGVYLSLNHGASWVAANAGLFGFSTSCFAYNGTYLFIGGQNQGGGGGVWRHAL